VEKHGAYSYCRCSPDWAVSLPGNGASAMAGPCFSVPAPRLCIGRILWIAGMFECAVKHASRSLRHCVVRVAHHCFARVAVRKAVCCFKL